MDTACVLAYVDGHYEIGKAIADRADLGESVVVPMVCLMEAYRRVDPKRHEMVEMLASLDNVETPPVEVGDCAFIGGWGRQVGSLDLAHAVLEAASRPIVPIMTGDPDAVRTVLAPGWPVLPLR
jgi:hypothetical protein